MEALPAVHGLHHFAWRCRDAEETRRFYEDLLGLPLAHVVAGDNVGSTGEYCSFVHLFFRMHDGSYVAFFDLGDGKATQPDPETPTWCNHLALEVATMQDLLTWKARLEVAGVSVLGPTNHEFVQSIYFFDPNGIRLELTCRVHDQAYMDKAEQVSHARLAEWTKAKQHRKAA